jgi:neprosin-like protein
MNRICAFVVVASFAIFSVTDAARAQPGPAFVSFDEFLKGVAAVRFEDYAPQKDLAVKRSEDFEAMRQHILSLYEGVTVAHSFLVDAQYFDCVPIDQQPSVRQLGLKHALLTPPPPTSGPEEKSQAPRESRGLTSPLTLGLMDPFGNAVSCEEGTIPMRRVTLEEMSRFETLEKFLQKSPWDGVGRAPQSEEPPAAPVPTHKYAHAAQTVNNYGGDSWLNLWSPPINGSTSQIFSLSQHWYVGGRGRSLQTVEGGWQTFPLKYHTTQSVLFIYWTADNYKSTGCYNLDCAAFVQINSNWYLGGSWTLYSSPGGQQYDFQLQWKLSGGNWWLYLQGNGGFEAIGYYPGTIYKRGQLTRFAQVIDYGGETVGTTSWPPMGSSGFASLGYQGAAYQRNIFYIDAGQTSRWSNLRTSITSPRCYTSIFVLASSASSWGSYLFFGGPGGLSC